LGKVVIVPEADMAGFLPGARAFTRIQGLLEAIALIFRTFRFRISFAAN
jgi:hypothetical protein